MKKLLSKLDKPLLVVTFIFFIFGLIMILSASSMESYMRYNYSPYHYFLRHAIFLVLGFILLIAETLVPGVFLLWWGLAAIVTAGVMALVPSLSLTVLAVFYAILAIVLSLLWWKYQHSKDNQDQSRTTLNQRDHTLLGKKGTVLEIGSNGIGRGAFGDTTWRIQGEHLTVNDLVVVERVDGITLLVKKVTE